MPEHEIEMDSPRQVILNSDVTFHVRSGEELLGHLLVSRGALEWRPARHSVNVATMTWEHFDQVMRAHHEGRLDLG
jgi:hypothetical protein